MSPVSFSYSACLRYPPPSSPLAPAQGLTHDGFNDLSEGVTIQDLATFSPRLADAPATPISIDTAGTLTLHANSEAAVVVSSKVRCRLHTTQLSLYANLDVRPGDVDMGNAEGLQYIQAGSSVDVAVRIHTPIDEVLQAFQLYASFPSDKLTSASGATFIPHSAWSGVTATLNEDVDAFQLTAMDAQSTRQGVMTHPDQTAATRDWTAALLSMPCVAHPSSFSLSLSLFDCHRAALACVDRWCPSVQSV